MVGTDRSDRITEKLYPTTIFLNDSHVYDFERGILYWLPFIDTFLCQTVDPTEHSKKNF